MICIGSQLAPVPENMTPKILSLSICVGVKVNNHHFFYRISLNFFGDCADEVISDGVMKYFFSA